MKRIQPIKKSASANYCQRIYKKKWQNLYKNVKNTVFVFKNNENESDFTARRYA